MNKETPPEKVSGGANKGEESTNREKVYF